MGKIIQLDETTVKKIAAGEVIERPASVIKELVENSIDAGADKISIEVNKGGIESIKIKDNGSGMSKEDALISYQLHTTSKLKTIEDLDRVFTFGFRGEALASISAVSQVNIHTSNSKESTEVLVENGELVSVNSKPRTNGTTITVNELFRHLPARKKFLRSDSTEYRYILLEVIKIALAYPEISFELTHNGKAQLNISISENLKGRIKDLFSGIDENNLLELNIESPIGKITGFIIHPEGLSIDRSKQFIFLNKRFILEKSLAKAIRNGYQTTISKDEQPAYFIFLEIDPASIDVNIHPRKLEAKIDRIGEVFSLLSNSIKKVIDNRLRENLRTKLSSFSESTPKQYNEFEHFSGGNSNPNQPNQGSNRSANPMIPIKFNSYQTTEKQIQNSMVFSKNLLESPDQPITNKLFQVLDTYIIVDKGNELQMIDQHAADERINFEKISQKVKNGEFVEKKDLLIPIILDIDSTKFSLLEDNLDLLIKYGLEIDIFGINKIRINSIPVFAREIKYTDLIDEIVENIEQNAESKLLEAMCASLACHSSIRAGRKLNVVEMQKVIDDLFKCETPYSCPHGRPIIWTITKNEIEKKFERKK